MFAGCSGVTPIKWDRFDRLSLAHARMVKGIMRRFDWVYKNYIYIDPFSGPGSYGPDSRCPEVVGRYGSPILAYRVLKSVFLGQRTLFCDEVPDFRCLFSDMNPDAVLRLICTLRMQAVSESKVSVKESSCESVIDSLVDDPLGLTVGDKRKPMGLIFFDPNSVQPWDHIKKFASVSHFSNIDILVNLNATFAKRLFRSTHDYHKQFTMRPTECLRWLGKKQILLWEPSPHDMHQFTPALCSNYDKFPEFKKLGFHYIDSPEGQRIVERIDYSESEKKARRMPPLMPGFEVK